MMNGQEMLDAAALATMPIPIVGDVAGLASDAYRFATDPESRTLENAAWASLGMLPFVPFGGMLMDAAQLAKPRGKIDAAYPPWGKRDFSPGAAPRNVTIYKNPSPDELARLKKRGALRVVSSKDGADVFAWPYDEALHQEVADDVFVPYDPQYRSRVIPQDGP